MHSMSIKEGQIVSIYAVSPPDNSGIDFQNNSLELKHTMRSNLAIEYNLIRPNYSLTTNGLVCVYNNTGKSDSFGGI